MTAIQTLRNNATAQTTNVVDLSIRHLLAKALTDSGKFEAINTKMDSRRNSLSIKVRGNYSGRNAATIEALAGKAGLDVVVRVTSSGYNETTFKVEKLVSKAGTNTTQKTLATALAKDLPVAAGGNIQIVLDGVSLGWISKDAANRIRAIVTEDQRPKFEDLIMVNPVKQASEKVTVPSGVADAIKQKVPSYAFGTWTVKATSGIVIVKDSKTNGYWVLT